MNRYCNIGKHFTDEDNFTSVTSTRQYKKADGTISVYKNTAKRHQCNSCLAKRYSKGKSKIVTKTGSIVVGGILVY